MNLINAVWFRYRSKPTAHKKGNKSLIYGDNMQCQVCMSEEDETQEQLAKCDFTKESRKNLNLGKRDDKIEKSQGH